MNIIALGKFFDIISFINIQLYPICFSSFQKLLSLRRQEGPQQEIGVLYVAYMIFNCPGHKITNTND